MKFIKDYVTASEKKTSMTSSQHGGMSDAEVSGFFLFYSSKPTWLRFNCDAEVIRELLRVTKEY